MTRPARGMMIHALEKGVREAGEGEQVGEVKEF